MFSDSRRTCPEDVVLDGECEAARQDISRCYCDIEIEANSVASSRVLFKSTWGEVNWLFWQLNRCYLPTGRSFSN